MPGPSRVLRTSLRLLLALPLLGWMGLALWFRLPGPGALKGALVLLGAAGILITWMTAPRVRAWTALLGSFALVVAWFLSIRPSNDRAWRPDVSRLATGEVEGSLLHMHNVRACRYRAEEDYDPVFEDRTYDLSQVQAMDIFLVSWGPRHIAHTIASWEFADGSHLAFSIETRKQASQQYSAVRGFFREYELCMVAADERDVVRLRTSFRGEQVRLYRLNTPPGLARDLLLAFVARANGLAAKPEWYNALTDNCTTAMIGPIHHRSSRLRWSWKLVASGHLDELLYDQGFVTHALPFAQLRERSLVNAAAQAAAGDAPDFSARIRAGLLPR